MKRTTEILATALLLLVAAHAGAQEARMSPGLSYLLDGAVRIYVVDESRCSAGPNSKEGGRWYLMEAEEKLEGLRAQFSKLDTGSEGGCMCGGPDIHFYAQTEVGETTYFGLDCEEYLSGVEIPRSLQDLLIPARPTFLGQRMGQTYIVDLPLEVEEPAARRAFGVAGLTLLTGGRWNGFTGAHPREVERKARLKETAPVHLLLEVGPFKAPRPAPEFPKGANEAQEATFERDYRLWYKETSAALRAMATERTAGWLDGVGLKGFLVLPIEASEHISNGELSTFSADLYLSDAAAVRGALASPKAKRPKVKVDAVEYRIAQRAQPPAFYQAALLLTENPTPEEIAKAKAVLPGIRRVVPLCECREKPRG